MPSPPGLVALIQACFLDPDDRAAQDQLYSAFRPFVLAVLISVFPGDPSLVEDAYHSAFARFLELLRQGAKPGINYEAYFVTMAKHCLLDELRRRNRLVPFDTLLEEELSLGLRDPRVRMDAEILLLQALDRLDRRCQFLITAYYIRGMDTPDLARRLKVQPDSVYVLLQRCRDQLRRFLTGSAPAGSAPP